MTTSQNLPSKSESPGEPFELPALPRQQKVVLVMDLVESVRLMAANERGVVDAWRGFVHRATTDVLPKYQGRMVKSLGDGIMVEFDSPKNATNAALQLHRYFDAANAKLPPEQHLYLRAGLNTADVYVDDIDIYGSGVNLAARVASLAGPGETMVTAEVRDGITDGLDAEVEDMGECHLKHVAEPVRAYRLGLAGPSPILTATTAPSPTLKPTVAVIPFASRSKDPDSICVGELLADGIIGVLGRTPELRIISRMSTAVFRHRSQSDGLAASLLNANYLVYGSYLVVGEKVLCTAELTLAEGGAVLWVERLASTIPDLCELQAELTQRVADGVHATILQREALNASLTPIPTLASYTLFLGGQQLMHQSSPRSFTQSRDLLDHLVERHPRSATARAWRAKWSILRVTRGLTNEPGREAADALMQTRRALDFEPDHALALAVEGFVHCHLKSDVDLSYQRLTSALAIDSSCSLAWLYLATVQGFRGETARAVASAIQALSLSPLDPMKYYYHCLLASAYMYDSQYELARQHGLKSWALNRYHAPTSRLLVYTHVELGELDAAKKFMTHMRQIEPDLTATLYIAKSTVAPDLRKRFAAAFVEAGLPR